MILDDIRVHMVIIVPAERNKSLLLIFSINREVFVLVQQSRWWVTWLNPSDRKLVAFREF